MSDLNQARRHASVGAGSTDLLDTGVPSGPSPAPLPAVEPDEWPDGPRRTRTPVRVAAAVTAATVLGAMVIGVAGRSAIGETPPQHPGVGQQVAAAGRADQARPPAAEVGADTTPFTTLRVEVDGSGEAELQVSGDTGLDTRLVTLPYRGVLATSGARLVGLRVTATALTAGAALRCRVLDDDRLVKADDGTGTVDCSTPAA